MQTEGRTPIKSEQKNGKFSERKSLFFNKTRKIDLRSSRRKNERRQKLSTIRKETGDVTADSAVTKRTIREHCE